MNTPKQDRLTFFQDLYQKTKTKRGEADAAFERQMKQYRGDKEIDGSTVNASFVRNITYEIIESQVETNIPPPKVTPARQIWSHIRCAQNVEKLLKKVRDKLPFEELNDLDERNTYIFGGSVWLVEWDNGISTPVSVGDVKVSVISPRDFFPQPGIYRTEDMEYAFIRYAASRDSLVRTYDIDRAEAEDAAAETDTLSAIEAEDDCVTVVCCFYRAEDGTVCKYAWSGELELEDITDYYSRKNRVCRRCGRKEKLCTCEKPKIELETETEEVVEDEITTSDGRIIPKYRPKRKENGEYDTFIEKQLDMSGLAEDGQPRIKEAVMYRTEQNKIPYYVPKSLPFVVRRNVSAEGNLFGQSDCDTLREIQQAVNKIESRIQQKLLRAGITPVLPEDASVAMNNRIFGDVIKLRPGESASDYGVIDNTPDISQDIAEAERLYQQAKRLVGITDAYVGQASGASESGEAVKTRANLSAGRLASKRLMKNAAYAQLDRIIFELYLAYADEMRPVGVFDELTGEPEEAHFNRYDFVELNPFDDAPYYDDDYLFSTDEADLDSDRRSLWQMAGQNYAAGVFGDPAGDEARLLYWLELQRNHYPGAARCVKIIRDRLQAQKAQQQAAMQMQREALQAQLPAIENEGGAEDAQRLRSTAVQ